eukprot:gene23586-31946_t
MERRSLLISHRCSSPSNLKLFSVYEKESIGTEPLDWPNLGFEYRQTKSFVVSKYRNGAWEPFETFVDPYIPIHIGATALHYGQACFEGLKAFHCKDGKVRIFRPRENAKRISSSCRRICMPEISEDIFTNAVRQVVRDNLSFLPPYGTGGALYIRPVLYGSGPRVGLQPSDEYTLVIMVMPVADYYRGGLKSAVSVLVATDFDRAAPRGVGSVKVAGNYAADILPNISAKKAGYPIVLYLDSKTNEYVEEFSTSNFIAVDKATGAFVTPLSSAILPSITNKSLMQLAADEGHTVEQRPVSIHEVLEGKFSEIGACGTAVVVTPVNKIYYGDQIANIVHGQESESAVGPVLKKLYNRIRNIQNGDEKDKFNWLEEL